METFAWDLSFGIFHPISFASYFSLRMLRVGTFAKTRSCTWLPLHRTDMITITGLAAMSVAFERCFFNTGNGQTPLHYQTVQHSRRPVSANHLENTSLTHCHAALMCLSLHPTSCGNRCLNKGGAITVQLHLSRLASQSDVITKLAFEAERQQQSTMAAWLRRPCITAVSA